MGWDIKLDFFYDSDQCLGPRGLCCSDAECNFVVSILSAAQ